MKDFEIIRAQQYSLIQLLIQDMKEKRSSPSIVNGLTIVQD